MDYYKNITKQDIETGSIRISITDVDTFKEANEYNKRMRECRKIKEKLKHTRNGYIGGNIFLSIVLLYLYRGEFIFGP